MYLKGQSMWFGADSWVRGWKGGHPRGLDTELFLLGLQMCSPMTSSVGLQDPSWELCEKALLQQVEDPMLSTGGTQKWQTSLCGESPFATEGRKAGHRVPGWACLRSSRFPWDLPYLIAFHGTLRVPACSLLLTPAPRCSHHTLMESPPGAQHRPGAREDGAEHGAAPC